MFLYKLYFYLYLIVQQNTKKLDILLNLIVKYKKYFLKFCSSGSRKGQTEVPVRGGNARGRQIHIFKNNLFTKTLSIPNAKEEGR